MAEKRICDECGAELPTNAPQGLCPRCLAAMGILLASAKEGTLKPPSSLSTPLGPPLNDP